MSLPARMTPASQSLQMISRPLMSPDELKALPKGNFIVTKTGTHPMKTKLELFFKWGITFDAPYEIKEHGVKKVAYADSKLLETAILKKYPPKGAKAQTPPAEQTKQPDEKSPVRLG